MVDFWNMHTFIIWVVLTHNNVLDNESYIMIFIILRGKYLKSASVASLGITKELFHLSYFSLNFERNFPLEFFCCRFVSLKFLAYF